MGIKINSLPFNFLTKTRIPVSSAPVFVMIAKNPPKIRTNMQTSTADSKPRIGDIKISDSFAPTVPLPLTISSPTKLASGKTCDKMPSPTRRIRIM